MAYTIDVSQKGARLAGIAGLQVPGQVIAVRRKASEAQFRVVWIGRPGTPQEGQFGIECIDVDKIIWDVDFNKVHEDFESIRKEDNRLRQSKSSGTTAQPPHYSCTGRVLVWADEASSECFETRLLAIGSVSCQVSAFAAHWGNIPLLLQIHTEETQITVKGTQRALEHDAGCWVDFTHIRRGDRRELQALIVRISGRKRPSDENTMH